MTINKSTKPTITTIAAGALLATTILAGAAANAADTSKTYISLTGEYIAAADADATLTGAGVSLPGKIDYQNGWGGLLAVGYQANEYFRTEIEGGYRSVKADTASVTVGGTTYTVSASDLESKAITGMANIYLNLPTGSAVSPYIGAGVGIANETDGGATAVAYQGMAGLDFKVSDNSTFNVGYRYFGTGDFENKYTIAGTAITEKVSVKAHAIDVGYRYSF